MHVKVIGVLLACVLACAANVAAAPARWTGRYTVRAGDSLTAIARRYHVSLQALARANRLDWQRPLQIGVVLHVPARSAPPAVGWTGSYVVRPGDTLSGIAVRYKVSLSRLAAVNHVDPAALLLIGTPLHVPTATLGLAGEAERSPYPSGAAGYDASYPNCGGGFPRPSAFAIVGLNHGRPFTANPCFASEWAVAGGSASVYINTGYSPTLFRHVTPDCQTAGSRRQLPAEAQQAYAIGCAEARAALLLLGETRPLAIWLDVEPDNTWSSHRALNTATIRGILDRLLAPAPHPLIGIYSNTSFWHQIVGGWPLPGLPEWVATGAPDPPGCPSGFAAGPVWLAQSLDQPLDLDTAC